MAFYVEAERNQVRLAYVAYYAYDPGDRTVVGYVYLPGQREPWHAMNSGTMKRVLLRLAGLCCLFTSSAVGQTPQAPLQPPGKLVDLGGYRVHLWCLGPSTPGAPTVVLSAGGGDFATDWSLVQRPLADSVRVCSYDRPGYGWSDPGPEPRTFSQEAYDLHAALDSAGEHAPFVLVGHSLGAFVARSFAAQYRKDVAGMVLVGPTNENGKLGFRGQFVLMRTLASNRPIPPPHAFAQSPPAKPEGAEVDSCRARAERTARIVRPYDQLRALAQRYRIWLLQHPSCAEAGDDLFAEQMAAFYGQWKSDPHPLGDLPLIVILGTQGTGPPPGLSLAEWRSDSMRIDLSQLSRRGRMVTDSLSGHHIQLDHPELVVAMIREVLRTR